MAVLACAAAAWPGGGVSAALAAPVARAGPAKPAGSILLINGDQVMQPQAGRGSAVTVVRAAGKGLAGATVGLSLDGGHYVIPEPALAYLGRGLDGSLFDVPALAAKERAGRLPVTVSYQARLHPLPGVTITRSGGGTASGYLTASSARVFGAALVRQFRADHATGSYGTDGMFAGESVALAGAAASPVPRPSFPMHTLTVTATDLAGKPDTGDAVFVMNVDNSARFGDTFYEALSVFNHGAAKFSVPAGNYFAAGFFLSASGAVRLVAVPQFAVPAGRPGTSVAVNERAADSRVAFSTPRPSVTEDVQFNLLRTPAAGFGLGIDVDNGTARLWVSPARPARALAGTLRVAAHGLLSSPPPASARYEYNLAYQASGAIPAQHHLVRARSLATADERFFQAGRASCPRPPVPAPSCGGFSMVAFFPWEGGPGGYVYPLSLPTRRTEYLAAGPDYFTLVLPSYGLGSYETDAFRVFTAGEHARENWNAGPLHAGVNVVLTPAADLFPAWPSASRAGNTLTLDVTPFTDNQPGHEGPGFGAGRWGAIGTVTGSYQVDQNGKKIADGNGITAAHGHPDLLTTATLSPGPSRITFTLNASRRGKVFGMATSSRTVWTWRSARRAGTVLPEGWACPGSARCVVQPLLTLEYAVAGLGLNESAPPGTQVLRVSARHLQLAASPKITGVSVAASFDGGKTWHRARVAGHTGSYRAVFTAPPGVAVALRTRAHDAAGGRITETITGAYRTAPQGAPAEPGRGPRRMRAACAPPRPGHARCLVLYAPQVTVNAAIAARAAGKPVPAAAATPQGWGPRDIQSAYRLPVSRNPHQTVAVVDAMSTPHLAADLAVYRKHFGLPACTTPTGCLRIVNQDGKTTPLPRPDPAGWGVEETLDVAMVSAACPHCRILVVEAEYPTFADLAAAEDTAARLGAAVISNSYGTRESGFTQEYASAYHHRGHAIVASSGDYGFTAASFPANLARVTAAGGTELSRAHNQRGYTERVWNNAYGASGSGCSAYVAKPAWQHGRHCPGRTVADVAAVAWNIPIYDSSLPNSLGGPWLTVGGTSVASPLIAGVFGLAGNAATITPGHEYAHASALFDITTGNNAWYLPAPERCGNDYLCVAKPGYDAPTGLGTPNGTGAY